MASVGKVVALISAALLFVGADANASDLKSTTCARFEIGGTSYAMLIPKGSAVRGEPDRDRSPLFLSRTAAS